LRGCFLNFGACGKLLVCNGFVWWRKSFLLFLKIVSNKRAPTSENNMWLLQGCWCEGRLGEVFYFNGKSF